VYCFRGKRGIVEITINKVEHIIMDVLLQDFQLAKELFNKEE
jgi:hypothetical protein